MILESLSAPLDTAAAKSRSGKCVARAKIVRTDYRPCSDEAWKHQRLLHNALASSVREVFVRSS